MDDQIILTNYVSVVCDDIDGGCEDTVIARFTPEEAEKAISLLLKISKYNGSAKIVIEEF